MPWYLEQKARQYAEERTTNKDKQDAFIAGAKWFAEQVWRMLDQYPYWDMMDKKTKEVVAQIALAHMQTEVEKVMKRDEALTARSERREEK